MQTKDTDDLSEPQGKKKENFQKRHPLLPPCKNCRSKFSELISEETQNLQSWTHKNNFLKLMQLQKKLREELLETHLKERKCLSSDWQNRMGV